jgi:hypothetical protein
MGPCSKCMLDLCWCLTSAPYFPNHIIPLWPTSTWLWGGVSCGHQVPPMERFFWGYAFPLVGHVAKKSVVRTIFLLLQGQRLSMHHGRFLLVSGMQLFSVTSVGYCGNCSHQDQGDQNGHALTLILPTWRTLFVKNSVPLLYTIWWLPWWKRLTFRYVMGISVWSFNQDKIVTRNTNPPISCCFQMQFL